MKKRVIFFLGSVICFSVIIGMIGFVKNKKLYWKWASNDRRSIIVRGSRNCHGYGCIGIR